MHGDSVGLLYWAGADAGPAVAFYFELREAAALPPASGIDGGDYVGTPFFAGDFLS